MADSGGLGKSNDARTRLLDVLLESSQYGLMLLDQELRIAWVSNAGAAAVYYEAESLIGRPALDFLDPSQSLGVLEAISKGMAYATDLADADAEAPGWQLGVRVRVVCGDGISRDFEFGGRLVPGEGASDLMLVFVDVSERARLEDVLTAVMERDLEAALTRFLSLAFAQMQAHVGIALHPSLGGASYTSAGAPPDLIEVLSADRTDAMVHPITAPGGALFGWLVVDGDDHSPWSIETTERLVGLLGLVLSNQATFTDLADAASTDPLTGLANRRVLDRALAAAEANASQGWALLYCDLDCFKDVNDEWGHDAGDVVLRTIGQRLSQVVRGKDLIARIGGDEYVILLQADRAQADQLLERLRAHVAEPIVDALGRFEVGISVGVATADTPEAVRALLAEGDRALRRDKAARQVER